jgi:hypothetical protein
MRRFALLGLPLLALSFGCSSASHSQSGSGGTDSLAPDPSEIGGGGSSSGGGGGAGSGSSSSGGTATGPGVPADGTATGSAAASSNGGGDGGVPAGVLTAGAWDDNRNYDFFNAYLAANASLTGIPIIAGGDRDAAQTLFAGMRPAKQRLDIAIVIDTTGSMGDEAAYLQSELENISSAINTQFPAADPHWALVAYRDIPAYDPGDAYVVESWDFTTDLPTFESALDGLTASGGGDMPESPDIGLHTMNTLGWRPDADVARMAFWIADAPQHVEKAPDMATDFADSHQQDVHLYPVSASGADELLEYTMRSGAQLTGGRYLFLTDDSGIGDAHLQPEIPCYFVTKLAKDIVRMVSIELSGVYAEPELSDIIRTGGNPSSGQCTIADAGSVSIF